MDPRQENPQQNAAQPNASPEPRLDLKLTQQAASPQSWFKVFKSNLKDFLTERPVKIRRGSEPSPFESSGFGSSLSDNFKEFWKPLPPSARKLNSDLLLDSKSWVATLWENIRDVISPRKLPPLEVTSEPVDVPEIWTKDKQFTKVQALSLVLHVVVIVLLVLPFLPWFTPPSTQANNQPVQMIDLSPYLAKLSMGNKKAGGGGGRANNAPATRGKLPPFTRDQFAPPEPKPPQQAKLVAQASLMVPNIHMPSPNLPNTGDPLSGLVNDSMGNGSGSGMGNGNGSGLGSGSEYGVGGGLPTAGADGYGTPVCVYCPDPQYSDEGFKLKIQGEVMLDVVIGVDGRATNVHVVKGLGYGLDQEAVKSAQDIWHFKPAIGPNGQPAVVRMIIDIEFHLY